MRRLTTLLAATAALASVAFVAQPAAAGQHERAPEAASAIATGGGSSARGPAATAAGVRPGTARAQATNIGLTGIGIRFVNSTSMGQDAVLKPGQTGAPIAGYFVNTDAWCVDVYKRYRYHSGGYYWLWHTRGGMGVHYFTDAGPYRLSATRC